MISIRPEEFSSRKITNYDDFQDFLSKERALVPSFPILEDYAPEQDWGEIFYQTENGRFRIFYGNELATLELDECLATQHQIPSAVTTQPNAVVGNKSSDQLMTRTAKKLQSGQPLSDHESRAIVEMVLPHGSP